MENSRRRMLTASEVGEYVFCAKAWKLRVEGKRPESPRLQAGTTYHQEHQSALHLAQRIGSVGKWATWLALAMAVIWLVIEICL
jgi:hypothetical protein